MERKAALLGITTCPLNEPPGFKVGDGKSSIVTPDGPKIAKEGQLYKIYVTIHMLYDTPYIQSYFICKTICSIISLSTVERFGLVISSIFPSRSIKSKISFATCEKDVDVKKPAIR